jgi:hypothetical protein
VDVQSLPPSPTNAARPRGRILPSDAFALGGITALAYGTTFVYEAGYLGHFGIPIWLIELDLSRVFVAAGGLTIVGSVVFWTLRLLPDRPAAIALLADRFLMPLLLLGLVLVLAFKGKTGSLGMGAGHALSAASGISYMGLLDRPY